MYDLINGNAPEALCQEPLPTDCQTGPDQMPQPMEAPRLRSLFALLSEISEYRKPRGIRYGLNTPLSIAVAALHGRPS